MKVRYIVAALAGIMLASTASAQWMVRARAVNIDPANKSDPVGGVGASDRIHVSSKVIPEVDISYFFTPNLAAELILTYPQKHDVSLDGANIGSFKHLPPTLTAQWHFMPDSQFDPYVGAGVNYTRISSVNLAGGTLDLEKDSFGAALQVGFDYKLDKKWSINFDVKKVWIQSDVMAKATGAKVSNVKVDPVLIGVGLGYRF